ncbi:hypothetical protein L484_012401 [Morus notabilis]|uniref:Retrotransposon gag domain-containing protein n=1 Tax=Morus notabilis TaxID=981085 RepID=W9QEM4_9ROSA|nr:hypothetical protein L484_012401 [Morus notabilis]
MEGRLEFVEKDVGELKSNVGELKGIVGQLSEDIGVMKEYIKELTGWMRTGGHANPPAEQARASASNGREGGDATTAANRSGYSPAPSAEESRFCRIEIPLFNGEDLHGWLFRLERYFQVQRVDDAEWVAATMIGLEGRALNWFQWMESKFGVLDWPTFKESSVAEFRERFELLLAPLREADEQFLIGALSNGLADEIKAEV